MKNFVGWAFFGRNKKKVFLKEKVDITNSSIPPIIERILKRREIKQDEIEHFLNPKIEYLYQYKNWNSLNQAIDLIKYSIINKKKIHLHSDYDADGITSLAMLSAGIQYFDGNFQYSISNRFKNGYGIPEDIFDDCIKNYFDLFISLDCGTSSFEIQQKAIKNNISFIIIDHHPTLFELDNSIIVCNTHLSDCPKAFSKFSTAGIVFKLMEGLYDSLNSKFPYNSYLRISSLGLAQDIVEMLGENHSIVSIGMNEIPKSKNKFLLGLLKSTGLLGKKIISDHLYYRLGPRLNAPGRMGDCSFLIDLFLSKDEKKIEEGILNIEILNKSRQELQEKTLKQAIKNINDEKIIVAYDPSWHIGVLGLVASRLAQENNKISFCFTKEGDLIKGSGRSVLNFSLLDILEKTKDLLFSYGGHKMACGIALKEENFEKFKEKLNEIAENFVFEEPSIEAEEEVSFKELLEISNFFTLMEPYGNKNPKPIFLSHNVRFQEKPRLYNNLYFMKLKQKNDVLPAVGFNLENIEFPDEFSLLYTPSSYNDNFSIKMLGILTK